MIHGVLIHPDGHCERRACEDKLEAYQQIVGGYIERVALRIPNFTRHDLIVNEDGKRLGLPHNAVATTLALFTESIRPNDRIVGPAFLVGVTRDINNWCDAHPSLVASLTAEPLGTQEGGSC